MENSKNEQQRKIASYWSGVVKKKPKKPIPAVEMVAKSIYR
ncbi:hypothetical protein [Okeania sp. SIO1I7]|nr:hypothetical protein [Okeania sp. SIO1I7]